MIPFEKLDWPIHKVWATSDLHYSHKNICTGVSVWPDKNQCRNFDTIEEMDNAILNSINGTVKEEDLLIIAGDFAFGGEQNIPKLLDNINCKNIIGVYGNHDHHLHKYKDRFIKLEHKLYLQFGMYKFVISHFPEMCWHNMEKGSIMLHGHLHGHKDAYLKKYSDLFRIMDVGIDVTGYLFNLLEIGKLMEIKKTHERHV